MITSTMAPARSSATSSPGVGRAIESTKDGEVRCGSFPYHGSAGVTPRAGLGNKAVGCQPGLELNWTGHCNFNDGKAALSNWGG